MQKLYRVVTSRGRVIDDMENLSLSEAEHGLCRALDLGYDAYLQDQPTAVDIWRAKNLTQDEVKTLIKIGFCQPKFYKPSIWRKAKSLMDEIAVPHKLARPHDYGRGKGKFTSDLGINDVWEAVAKLICQEAAV